MIYFIKNNTIQNYSHNIINNTKLVGNSELIKIVLLLNHFWLSINILWFTIQNWFWLFIIWLSNAWLLILN